METPHITTATGTTCPPCRRGAGDAPPHCRLSSGLALELRCPSMLRHFPPAGSLVDFYLLGICRSRLRPNPFAKALLNKLDRTGLTSRGPARAAPSHTSHHAPRPPTRHALRLQRNCCGLISPSPPLSQFLPHLTGHVLRGVSDCPLCRPDCGGRSHVPSLAASSLAMAIGCCSRIAYTPCTQHLFTKALKAKKKQLESYRLNA